MDISEVRKRAWATRRQKYGERGHGGSYHRSCARCADMLALVIRLYREGLLSEGQVAKATGMHRIQVRTLADEQGGMIP